MFKTICALLRKKPEIMDIVSLSEPLKQRPALKKATTKKVATKRVVSAKKTTPKKKVKK